MTSTGINGMRFHKWKDPCGVLDWKNSITEKKSSVEEDARLELKSPEKAKKALEIERNH